MGAIGEGGARVLDADVCRRARISEGALRHVERREREELEARVARHLKGRQRVDVSGRVAVVVDDGIATGSTARAACEVARQLGAPRVVLAVPVLLGAASRRNLGGQPADSDVDVEIPVGANTLKGHLHVPEPAPRGRGVRPRQRQQPTQSLDRLVAGVLYRAGLGTLLLDLLTPDEEVDRVNVFDIELLAGRLTTATEWLATRPDTASRPGRLLRCQHRTRGRAVGRRGRRAAGLGRGCPGEAARTWPGDGLRRCWHASDWFRGPPAVHRQRATGGGSPMNTHLPKGEDSE